MAYSKQYTLDEIVEQTKKTQELNDLLFMEFLKSAQDDLKRKGTKKK